ncbi:MAG TPA: SH3 domain-containing protein [Burkholderiaceae bacterium]|jgi:hypothetical protein
MKTPNLKLCLLFAAGLIPVLAPTAALAETARVKQAAELHADSQSDSATLASLPDGAQVEVLQRRGAWTQVKASGQTGWVRMMSLRFDSGSASASPNSGNAITQLASLGRKSNSGTETNAVRGINEEDLRNAQPNPAAFQRMQQFATDKSTAQNFGRKAKLNTSQVAYLPDGNNSSR